LFSKLIMEAKLVGIGHTSHERAAMFVGTILGPAFRPVIAEINAVEEAKRDWPLVLSKYNAESARRKARPLARSTAPRSGAVLATVGQPRISREAAEQGRKDRRPDMSKVECYECHKTGHYARDCWSNTKGGSNQPRNGQVSKNHHRGQRGAQRGRNTHTRNDDSKEEGRISLSKALFDEHESWVGLTVGSEPMQSWADKEDDGKELEPIKWPDEGAIEANPWADMAMFTQDSILLAGEPVQPTWVVDSGATHHITACRELLRDARKLEEPKVFGLADRTASMRASEVGEVHVRLGSGRRITLKDVYYVPASRVSLLSLSSLLKHGWTVDMRDGGGTIKRGKERLTLQKDGPLWTTVVGTVEPLILAAGTGRLGKSVLEEEHQRLGHVGREKLLDLAKAGNLKGTCEDLRNDPFRTDQCEVCLRAKIERYPKTGEAPILRGGEEGIALDVDLAGPLDLSVDGHRYLFVGIERSSGILFATPIETKADALKALKGAVAKLERQLGERLRVIRSDGGTEFGGGEAIEWFKTTGIQHYTSPRYTPELNGAAERTVRTVKEMTATLLLDSSLPNGYWSHAARYAAVILMKTSDKTPTPWTRLTGRANGIDSLRRFGQRCLVQVPREVRRKNDLTIEKGELGILLGQSETVSGWIIRRDRDGSMVHSRDVQFLDSAPTELIHPLTKETEPAHQPTMHIDIEGGHEVEDDEAEEESTPTGAPQVVEPTPSIAEVPIQSQPKSRISVPSRRIPARDRWAMVPIEQGEPVDTYDGPRSKTGRPVRPVNRFVGLSSEMAIDGDKTILEPKSVKEALAGKDAAKWLASMESEIDNIESKGTWIETKLPEGRKAVGRKWIFKVKTDADGTVVKYKSILVAQGFPQIPGIDYEETFAPVGGTTSLRLLLTIAATNDLEVRQADVEGAYLNGKLDVELYMAYPEGMTPKKGCDSLRLVGSLYGLKQSGRTWWIELGKGLEALGFKHTESDWGLYYRTKSKDRGPALLLTYVDDIVVAAESSQEIDEAMKSLSLLWRITELGQISTILGMMSAETDKQGRYGSLSPHTSTRSSRDSLAANQRRHRCGSPKGDRRRMKAGMGSHPCPSRLIKKSSVACSGLQVALGPTSGLLRHS
jgi:hypothetical protein